MTFCPNVYFQPPKGFLMQYPCIVYRKEPGLTQYADNSPYKYDQQYEVTFITLEPDSDIPDKLIWLPKSRLSTTFVADNLYHYVFAIYF